MNVEPLKVNVELLRVEAELLKVNVEPLRVEVEPLRVNLQVLTPMPHSKINVMCNLSLKPHFHSSPPQGYSVHTSHQFYPNNPWDKPETPHVETR